MTFITWACLRCVQELTTILGPQNRTQGRCAMLMMIISTGRWKPTIKEHPSSHRQQPRPRLGDPGRGGRAAGAEDQVRVGEDHGLAGRHVQEPGGGPGRQGPHPRPQPRLLPAAAPWRGARPAPDLGSCSPALLLLVLGLAPGHRRLLLRQLRHGLLQQRAPALPTAATATTTTLPATSAANNNFSVLSSL